MQSNDAAATALSFHSLHWLTKDDNGSDLVNFPFAFVTFMILTTGPALIGWGITVTSAWLAVTGTFITLVGSAL